MIRVRLFSNHFQVVPFELLLFIYKICFYFHVVVASTLEVRNSLKKTSTFALAKYTKLHLI